MKHFIALLAASCGVSALRAQPVNDEPCNALPLVLTEVCTPITVDNTGGSLTADPGNPACANLTTSDVWYTVTVPLTGIVQLTTAEGSITDAGMAAYTAPSCSGPFTLLACDDDTGPGNMSALNFTTQAPGTTIYVRVWGYGNAVGTFNLCAFGPTTLPPGDCVWLMELTGYSGIGWGTGARVGISINGGPFQLDSLDSGHYGARLIGFNVGDLLVVNYTSGLLNFENGVRMGLLGYPLPHFMDAADLTTGVLYSTTVDCMPAPPTPGDCIYAEPICADTAFNNSSLTVGYAADLNGLNQGCLASGERSGVWTHFTIATSGTLGLVLSPDAPGTDIDFAIWGPIDSLVCPPVGAPLRCSFATTTNSTGLSPLGTGPTEGAGGDGWCTELAVLAGEQYMLHISNFTFDSSNVNLTWQLTNGASLACPLPPLADLAVSDPLIVPGASVDMLDLSDNAPTAWFWSMPGGSPSVSQDQHPSGIVYNNPGCYDVTLIATNADGSGSTVHTCAVEVDTGTGINDASSPFIVLEDADGITVRNTDGGALRVQLLNTMGQVVRTAQGTAQLRLGTDGLRPGAYVLHVHAADAMSAQVFTVGLGR